MSVPFSRRRVTPIPAQPPASAQPTETPDSLALTWPAAAVLITFMVLAAVLFALGHPVGAVIGLLGAVAAIAIETIRRITGSA